MSVLVRTGGGPGMVQLEVLSGGSNIRIWDGPATNAAPVTLPKTWDPAPDTIEETFYVEGIEVSESVTNIEFRLRYTPDASTNFDDTVKTTVIKVESVSADKNYEKVGDSGSKWNVVGVKGSAGDVVTLTLTITPDTTETRNAISWTGATVDPSDKLKATVPVDQSVKKDVTVNIAGTSCREIQVWPSWVTVGDFRGDNANGQALSSGNEVVLPSGITLGTPGTTSFGTVNAMKLKGTVAPGGVSALSGVQFDFKRTIQRTTFWKNTGDATWAVQSSVAAGTPDDSSNSDEDLHDANDVIWVVDLPGTGAGTANRDFAQQDFDMRESVDLILNKPSNVTTAMSGDQCSNVFSWYAIVNVKKDSTTGNWTRNNTRRNEIKQGTLTIGTQPNE